MCYTMHHGIGISKFAEDILNYGVGAQLGLRNSSLLGDRSDRLIYVEPMQIHADLSDRSVAPV